MQITHSSPDMKSTVGQSTAFSEYVKFVADERNLPTFWTEQERKCLWSTTLDQHVDAKLRALEKEYSDFCEASKHISWSKEWWGDVGCLNIEDWKVVDAMYRSRAMDFDSYGLCLVPIMDMANHGIEEVSNAMYSIEGENKEARLYLDGKDSVDSGDEIKIIYGLNKGASEMLFSYGFIDDKSNDAGSLMLGWEPPADDELRDVKMEALNLEPGFKIFRPSPTVDMISWAGPCVWAMAVNQEDGLRIRLIEDDNGNNDLQVWFKDSQVPTKAHLEGLLRKDRMTQVFILRAYSYVQARLGEEIARREALEARTDADKVPEGINPDVSPRWKISQQLRALESELLARAQDHFQANISWLMTQQDIQDYLAGIPLRPKPPAHDWEDRPDEHNGSTSSDEEAAIAVLISRVKDNGQEGGAWANEDNEEDRAAAEDQEEEWTVSPEQVDSEEDLSEDSLLDTSWFRSEEDWLRFACSVPLMETESEDEGYNADVSGII